MLLTVFIQNHRDLIDKAIKCIVRNEDITLDDNERKRWVVQDEMLRAFAQSFGTDI